jgi:hypothetical protein
MKTKTIQLLEKAEMGQITGGFAPYIDEDYPGNPESDIVDPFSDKIETILPRPTKWY